MRKLWDDVVENSKNGNFLHLRGYIDYHRHRFNEQSVIVEKKGKPVAVFPCNRVDGKVVSHDGLTYAGLIYGVNLRAVDVLEIFNLLKEHYQRLGVSAVLYKAIPHVFHRYPAEEDLYALFQLNARLVRRDLSCAVPLQNRMKLSDSRKRAIRKAKKNGLVVVEGGSLEEFHRLLEIVLEKFSVRPAHRLEELKLLQGRFPGRIRLFTAEKSGEIYAGVLVYDFGHVAHTQYLANSDEGRQCSALDYIIAELLENAFKDHRYLSFGISSENGGRLLNEGLAFQKEGFGGRSIVHDFYDFNL